MEQIARPQIGTPKQLDEEQVVKWYNEFNRVSGTLKRKFDKERNQNCLTNRVAQWSSQAMQRRARLNGGDRRLQALLGRLAEIDKNYQRSPGQKVFHDSFIAASIRHIYKDEFRDNYLRILDENNWTQCRQEVFICCPRRFGKTFAVSMFAACYAVSQPESTMCIFSPSRRQSTMLLDQIRKFVCELSGGQAMIVKSTQEDLWLKGPNGVNDVRKIASYPSRVSTLKGVGGDVVICEEAAAMDMAVFYEVVVPLMQLDRTALICISTVLGADNFYSKLLKLKDDKGSDFFNKHEFYLACKACMDADIASECTHKMNELPPWQSARKHQRIRAMMSDQKELLERETSISI